jgi:hypothetical protein
MARQKSTHIFHVFYSIVILWLGMLLLDCSFRNSGRQEGKHPPRPVLVGGIADNSSGIRSASDSHGHENFSRAIIMGESKGMKQGLNNQSDPAFQIAQNTAFLMKFVPRQQDETAWPRWLIELCPEVVKHFTKFPYFTEFSDSPANRIPMSPWMTTLYAAHSVCSASVAQMIASAVSADLYLHAGSHLGAILHGGPIPWDDDVDVFIQWDRQAAFMQMCNKLNRIHPDVVVKCFRLDLCVKLSLETKESHNTSRRWKSPFLDVFGYKMLGPRIVEVGTNGKNRVVRFQQANYFPVIPFYFGGITMLGPQKKVASTRYNFSRCVLPGYVHRLERNFSMRIKQVDCDELREYFPFHNGTHIRSGAHEMHVLTDNVLHDSFTRDHWSVSAAKRAEYRKQKPTDGPALTRSIPDLDTVEINNDISREVLGGRNYLSVVFWNAWRGKYWLQAVGLLTSLKPDVIILNDMDIGMARSGQQHTTRNLAYTMGMNYAWGLEFMELTNGNKREQKLTPGMWNHQGLHGNAILSKFPLSKARIFRDPVGEYFSIKKTPTNAFGTEKRLGGRMALLINVNVGARSVILGSVNRLKAHTNAIKKYVGGQNAVIAGDQEWGFCDRTGLKHVDDQSHYSWPSSCESSGTARGDIICSNMDVAMRERTFRPCKSKFGINVTISDHSLTHVVLSFK